MKHKNGWEKFVDMIVDSLGYAIVRFAPVIAPIPSIAVILEVSGYSILAWITVVAIEMVGYAISDKMVESVRRGIFSWRNAIWPVVVYALVIEGLMLGYRIIPAWMDNGSLADAVTASVSMFYPFFTIAGAGLYALHEYLKEVASDTTYDKEHARQAKNEDALSDRELKRQRQQIELEAHKLKLAQDAELERERAMMDLRIKEQKATVKTTIQPVQESVQKSVQEDNGKRPNKPEILDRMIVHYRENPHLSAREMADLVGISKSSVSNYLDELGQKNIVHVNGNGVEVLRK